MIKFLFFVAGICVLIFLSQKPLVYFRIFRLKKKIQHNPLMGTKETDGSYSYAEQGYSISYKIRVSPAGIKTVAWLSLKRRLAFLEKKIINIKRNLNKFFLYQRWFVLFRPSILFFLIGGIIIFYFGLVETQKTKIERLKWVVASVTGATPDQIEYIGGGRLEISARRKTAVDRINEPIRYTFNLWQWFFSSETAFVTRWRGQPYGYVTHPVVYNERGEVWLNKEGTWRYGKFTNGRTIEWDIPQGTGVRAGKVTGHKISTPEGKLYIPDK